MVKLNTVIKLPPKTAVVNVIQKLIVVVTEQPQCVTLQKMHHVPTLVNVLKMPLAILVEFVIQKKIVEAKQVLLLIVGTLKTHNVQM